MILFNSFTSSNFIPIFFIIYCVTPINPQKKIEVERKGNFTLNTFWRLSNSMFKSTANRLTIFLAIYCHLEEKNVCCYKINMRV